MLLHIRTTSGSVRIFLKRKAIFSFCVLIQLILMSNCLSTDQFMSILVYGIHGMIPYFLIWAISENSDNKHITTVHRLSKFCSYHCKPACFPSGPNTPSTKHLSTTSIIFLLWRNSMGMYIPTEIFLVDFRGRKFRKIQDEGHHLLCSLLNNLSKSITHVLFGKTELR